MKSKAQVSFYAIMLTMVLLVLILAMIPVGKKFNDDAMNTTWNESYSFENSTGGIEVGNITHTGLDCENPDLNMFQHGTCIITDFGFAYFFGGLLLIALGVLGARVILGGNN